MVSQINVFVVESNLKIESNWIRNLESNWIGEIELNQKWWVELRKVGQTESTKMSQISKDGSIKKKLTNLKSQWTWKCDVYVPTVLTLIVLSEDVNKT